MILGAGSTAVSKQAETPALLGAHPSPGCERGILRETCFQDGNVFAGKDRLPRDRLTKGKDPGHLKKHAQGFRDGSSSSGPFLQGGESANRCVSASFGLAPSVRDKMVSCPRVGISQKAPRFSLFWGRMLDRGPYVFLVCVLIYPFLSVPGCLSVQQAFSVCCSDVGWDVSAGGRDSGRAATGQGASPLSPFSRLPAVVRPLSLLQQFSDFYHCFDFFFLRFVQFYVQRTICNQAPDVCMVVKTRACDTKV